MRKKKSSDYKYSSGKIREWQDRYKSKMTPEQIAARKAKQREYNKIHYEKRKKERVTLVVLGQMNCNIINTPLKEDKI